jgi:general secretion pathway protein B
MAVSNVLPPVSPRAEVSSNIAVAESPKNTAQLPIFPFAPVSDKMASPGRAKSESPRDSPKDISKTAHSTAPASVSATARPTVAPPQPADGMPARDVSPAPPKNLPEMTIAGYIHDDQEGSMAMINDKLVREGDEISPGLRLEKILPDGAIFSYRGERFRR